MPIRKSRFGEEQLIRVLREDEAGGGTEEASRRYNISSATLYKRRAKY